MAERKFFGLIRWELEEYLSLPVLAFLIASAIIAVLIQPGHSLPHPQYANLHYGSGTVLLILTMVAGAFFARSYAGSLGRGEIKLMLSYPIKRWQLFLSKFTAMFLTIFIIYTIAFSLHIYLDGLSLFEPMFFLSLFSFLLQLMLACSIAIAVSMVTRSEIMSILAAVLLLLGVDNVVGTQSYLSAQGREFHIFQYFGKRIYGSCPFGDNNVVTATDVSIAILFPIAVFSVLISLSFLYFTRFMEVD